MIFMFKSFVNVFRFAGSILKGLKDPEFRGLLLFVIAILASGTYVYHLTEKWRWLDSFYFSVTTLTTVGYGDFTPKTDFGKVFTMIYIFLGVGVILGFINVVARHASNEPLVNKKTKK
jgi:voltage-gated potassium channel